MNILKQIYRFLNPKFQNVFLEYHVDTKPRHGHGKPPHPQLESEIAKHKAVYKGFLTKSLQYKKELQYIQKEDEKTDKIAPGWNSGYVPGLDIVVLYTLVSSLKPKKYIEIGSGTTTKVVHKARKDQNLPIEITCIDPMPRQEISKIADKIIEQPCEKVDLQFILDLEAGDILFIDNSHRILPNSDSMVFYLELLPFLKKGVIVQVHDIYIPYDYPQFICDRFYSEQYGLAINLLANPKRYVPIMPNYYISEQEDLASTIEDLWKHPNLENVEKHGGSFWFEIGE